MTVQILLYNYMGDLVGRAISCLDLPVLRTGREEGTTVEANLVLVPILR